MYGFTITVNESFDDVITKVSEELKKEGFGIMSDINIQGALKKNLGVDTPAHRILGACHPPSAHKVLEAEPNISMLLPCNVTVRQENDKVIVGFMDPLIMTKLIDNPIIAEVAKEIRKKLDKVKNALA